MQLNPEQNEAVYHEEGPLLILAGAGSGKTRVITNRIRNLIDAKGVSPRSICAVTFTNKSAEEMKDRLRSMTGKKLQGIFVGTFHSLGLRILRENIEDLPLSENFTIQGQDDQYAIAADIQKEFSIDPEMLPDKVIIWNISQAKNSGLPQWKIGGLLEEKYGMPWADYFDRYQNYLRNTNSVDFDDLILMTRDLLQQKPEIRKKYRDRWQHFLVDEFQDTNPLQFDLLHQLIPPPHNLCAVGDDDQSIYGWRGADIRIILNFRESFPSAKIIYLEQNYRSTQTILDLANATIANNSSRHEKKLWSARGRGENAQVLEADTSENEAELIADQIALLQGIHKIPLSEISILFRTNFQSRPFEEELRRRNIPYHLSGGYQFFDRKEIKDLIAYLRFIANPSDERSLLRIINFPRRNVGDSSLQKLRTMALLEKRKLWEMILELEALEISLPAPAFSGLLEFRDFIQKHEHGLRRPGNLSRAFTAMLEDMSLETEFMKQGVEENKIQGKMYNIKELVNSMYYFENQKKALPGAEGKQGLFEYLHYLSLVTADREDETITEKVQLMTLHLAKGLEFRAVFLTGMEDGILPHKRSIDEDTLDEGHSLEEERRLFYVGITRAKEHLFFSYARMRRSYGVETEAVASRFLSELPGDLMNWEPTESTNTVEDLLSLIDSF